MCHASITQSVSLKAKHEETVMNTHTMALSLLGLALGLGLSASVSAQGYMGMGAGPHMQEMQAHQQEMMKLYQDGQPDSKQLLQAHKQMQERQLKLFEARLKAQDELTAPLPEGRGFPIHREPDTGT
jgi:uncharacterized protein HemX